MLSFKVFRNNKLQAQFQRDGYVVISGVFKNEYAELLNFYKNNLPSFDHGGFHSTHFFKDRAYKRSVHETIKSLFWSKLEAFFSDYDLIFANFMVKEPRPDSVMPLHADWTYVNEDKFVSLGIWCPLVDTNEMNGMLGVIPFSHDLASNTRGPKIVSAVGEFNEYIIKKYGKLLSLKAGDAVIYNHRLLHFSESNISNTTRVAVNLVAVPAKAEVYHYLSLEYEKGIRKYIVKSEDFFLNYDHFEEPDNSENFELINLDSNLLSREFIDKKLHRNESFLTTIFKLFKSE